MKTLSDEDLMHEVSRGNLDTMSFLFERYHMRVFNFLYKMCGDRDLSEDLTQDVFYKVIKYKDSYNGGKFSSWVYTIARNGLSNYYRTRKEDNSKLEEVMYKLGEEYIEEESGEEIAHLHRMINKLKPNDKELLVLNKLQGIRYEELAEITGNTAGAVKVKVHRAVKKLKEFYFQKI
ncbi:sigma-70 family RNA polymerase sigma factor [Leptobacterium flavescens]|uniref:Sigma-70 family RNA polymerase sigma factor n=1 Tax=Leptobacterium flavescens TaxID=472055 RepID=A0A6P0UM20_9FLAO|nr:RNA polymerase sigma factor [Leptobacterium flavescens]NER13612.1 sigma-70 family RNA polymerase sigma factor [Leptobacterium flavescens]